MSGSTAEALVGSLVVSLSSSLSGIDGVVEAILKSDHVDQCQIADTLLAESGGDGDDSVDALFHRWLTNPQHQNVDALWMWLYSWYRESDQRLQRYALQHISAVLYTYLVAKAQQRNDAGAEACLLAIYNQEVALRERVHASHQQEVPPPCPHSFRMPALDRPSVFHNPAAGSVTASTLRSLDLSVARENKIVWRLPSLLDLEGAGSEAALGTALQRVVRDAALLRGDALLRFLLVADAVLGWVPVESESGGGSNSGASAEVAAAAAAAGVSPLSVPPGGALQNEQLGELVAAVMGCAQSGSKPMCFAAGRVVRRVHSLALDRGDASLLLATTAVLRRVAA